MAVQIVMDLTGDTRHEFDTADAMAAAQAERRFKRLMNADALLLGIGFSVPLTFGLLSAAFDVAGQRSRRRGKKRVSSAVGSNFG